MINNYLKKKTENRARIAATDDPKIVELFEWVFNDETDQTTEISRGTTRVRHLNDLINAEQAAKDAYVAQHQQRLDNFTKESKTCATSGRTSARSRETKHNETARRF